MGFTEPPVVTGTEQMLYYIISHSLWFGDITNRYMPNYKNDLLLNTFLNETIENPEDMLQMNPMYSYNRYLLCSLMEYGKLYRYMTHCSSRGLGLELYDGDFSVLIDDFTESQSCSEKPGLSIDASFVVHPIDGELSLSKVIRFSSRGPQTSSMVSHRRIMPAISKSEFVMFPPGLFAVFMSLATSSGHCHQKIVGTQGDSSPMTTPPAP
jgi:hypothetical protein